MLIIRMIGLASLMLLNLSSVSDASTVSQEQIQAIVRAQSLPPSMEVSIRESGPVSQYSALDSPTYIGKKIQVHFYQDREAPGSNDVRYSVPQLVLTPYYLDSPSQGVIEVIKRESMTSGKKFREVGAWVVYTDRNSYRSETITSNDPYMIENRPLLQVLDNVISQIQLTEGYGAQITDIDLYHTHYERGEAFSPGDQSFQANYYGKKIKNLLATGGNFNSYAVPVQGEVLFLSNIRKQ